MEMIPWEGVHKCERYSDPGKVLPHRLRLQQRGDLRGVSKAHPSLSHAPQQTLAALVDSDQFIIICQNHFFPHYFLLRM